VRRLYSSHNRVEIQQLHDLLQANGIACMVRNDYLSGAAGELPPTEVWPEIWLIDSANRERAEALLAEALAPVRAHPWQCPGCGEQIEATFGRCWQCGHEAPDST